MPRTKRPAKGKPRKKAPTKPRKTAGRGKKKTLGQTFGQGKTRNAHDAKTDTALARAAGQTPAWPTPEPRKVPAEVAPDKTQIVIVACMKCGVPCRVHLPAVIHENGRRSGIGALFEVTCSDCARAAQRREEDKWLGLVHAVRRNIETGEELDQGEAVREMHRRLLACLEPWGLSIDIKPELLKLSHRPMSDVTRLGRAVAVWEALGLDENAAADVEGDAP